MRCVNCNKEEAITIDGYCEFCDECRNQTARCSHCGLHIEGDECVETINGEHLCYGCDSKTLTEENFVE